MKAVIPAAGLGTRMLPATKSSPKEMLPVVDKPTIQHVVEECVASGIRDILIITGRGKRAIEDHFDRSLELEAALAQKGHDLLVEEMRRIAEMANIHYVRQRETRGLGHAVLCARPFVGDEPFALLLGDDLVRAQTPCTKQLMDVHARRGGSVLAIERLPRARLGAYGVVAPGALVEDRLVEVRDLVEKPHPDAAPSEFGIMGRYVLSPTVFAALETTGPGVNGEIQLTDALRKLARTEPVWGYHFSGQRFDVGTSLEWLKTNVDLALDRPDLAAPLRTFLEERLGRKG